MSYTHKLPAPIDGDLLPALSATKKGGVPATGTPSGKFLKDDGTWAVPTGGTGDVVGPASAVNERIAVFDGVTGKLIKDGGTTISAINSAIAGKSDTGHTHAESTITFTDITTNDVSVSAHGYCPKLPGGTTTFLRGDGTWAAVSGAGDVVGPASATDNALVRFDATTGKLVQNSLATLNDTGALSLVDNLSVTKSTIGQTAIAVTNANTGTAATASLNASNGTTAASYSVTGTNFSTVGAARASQGMAWTNGANGWVFAVNSTGSSEVFRWSSGTGFTELMQLTNTGTLLIGTTDSSGGHKLKVSGTVSFSSELTTGGTIRTASSNASLYVSTNILGVTYSASSMTLGNQSFTITANVGTLGLASTTDLIFSSNGERMRMTSSKMTADWSHATFASRYGLMTSITNSSTTIPIYPNGTATTSYIYALNHNNADLASIGAFGCDSTAVKISAIRGSTSASFKPIQFHTGSANAEVVKFDENGNAFFAYSANDDYVCIGTNTDSYSTLTRLIVEQAGTNSAKVGLRVNNRPVITVNGTYSFSGTHLFAEPNISSGITESGYVSASNITAWRNLAADAGTLTALYGSLLYVGHTSNVTSSTFTTTSTYGLNIGVYEAKGVMTNIYALRIVTAGTGATVTNRWALYQEDSAYNNYLNGRLFIGTNDTSGSYKLKVTGTALFSSDITTTGALTLGTGIAINGTTVSTADPIRVKIGTSNAYGIGIYSSADSAGGSQPGIVFYNSTGTYKGGIYYDISSNLLRFNVDGYSTDRFELSSTLCTLTTGLKVGTGFGCNGKTAQTSYASGGALAAYAAGSNGLSSGAEMSALHALVVAIRAALVANGIMS